MNYQKQEINGAIAILQQTCRQYELLRDTIRNEYEYHYESMKLPGSDGTFLEHYGAFMALYNVMKSGGETQFLHMTTEMDQRRTEILTKSE